jgi:type VI secretion system secreted protein VgrG
MPDPLDVEVTFEIDCFDDQLHVLSFEGREAISQYYELKLVLACENQELDLMEAVLKPAFVTLEAAGNKRLIHGVVNHMTQHETARNFTVYRITLVPQAWKLTQRYDCRIFQEKTMTEIVKSVLEAEGVEFQIHSKGNQEPQQRDFCVQYQETDWNFVNRLLEEEGYCYYFEHTESGHTMVISNDPQVFEDISGESTVPYHQPDTTTPEQEHVYWFTQSMEARTGIVSLMDHNYLHPSLDYSVGSASDIGTDAARYHYPGLYTLPEHGRPMAKAQVHEQDALRRRGQGQSDCIRLEAGRIFKLDGHPRNSFNERGFLVTEVRHHGEKHPDLEAGAVSRRIRYHNEFAYTGTDLPYRPPRVTRRPTVLGSQTAIVTGPQGSEIYTDKHGRVKIHFHWDRIGDKNENASAWIRVSQYWAGPGYGAVYIPRVGHEVVVDFMEGNPDRPIIVGEVYHAQNVPPLHLPKDATRSTIKTNTSPGGSGFNEIRFEDKKGKEEIYTHAQKDQNETVRNNHTTRVGANQSRTIQKDRTALIKDGDDNITVDSGCRNVEVEGDANLTVRTGGRNVDVKTASYYGKAKEMIALEADNAVDIWGKQGVYIRGETGGTSILGTGDGVKITGTEGIGVDIYGSGSAGVNIQGRNDVKAKAVNTAKVEAKNVELSGSVKVKISGGDIEITGGTVTVRGNASVNIDGGGSTADLNAGGVTVSGTLIKLNA